MEDTVRIAENNGGGYLRLSFEFPYCHCHVPMQSGRSNLGGERGLRRPDKSGLVLTCEDRLLAP